MSPARTALVALLVLATVLFAAGVLAERSRSETFPEPPSTHSETGEPEGIHEAESVGAERASAETRETLFGVDLESTPLLVLAVLAGLGGAATCATRLGQRAGPLLAVAVIVLAWAALDVREVVHQLDESNTGIALIAIAVATLHAAAGVIAARLAARGRHAGAGSRGRPGTMPA